MEKKPVSHIMAGVIIGLVSIVLFLTYYFTGISFQKNFLSWLPSLIVIVMVALYVLQHARENNNTLTFGALFNFGFKITTIFVLVMTLFYILMLYLYPEYKVKFMEDLTREMDKQQNLNDEQKEMGIEFLRNNFNIYIAGGALLMNVLIGTIGSLIGAALAKKNPTTPFDNFDRRNPTTPFDNQA